MLKQQDRRGFLATLSGFATMAVGRIASGQESTPRATPPSSIDVSWIDKLKGKHKHVFDLEGYELGERSPLRQPFNYLAAHRQVSHLESPDDINVIMGISRRAFPMNAPDVLWEKYKLGERFNIKDAATGRPSTRNIFLGKESDRDTTTVRGLHARGVMFWQCNFALINVSTDLAGATGGKPDDVYAELAAGLLPGVHLVPAHVWAVGYAQEHGFAYEKL